MNNNKLKRLLKKVVFLLILTILIWLFKLSFVNAETISPSYFRFSNAETLPIEFWTNSGDISRPLTINSAKGEDGGLYDLNKQNYVNLTMCVAGDNSNTYYISNASLNGAFENGDVDFLNTGVDCKAQGYGGRIYKFYLKIHRWAVPSGGADVYQVSSYFHIVNNGANATLYKIISIEINDKNTFIDDSILVSSGKGQSTIINQNETIINNQNQINSNLTDETPPNLNGLENSAGWLQPGPVDSIINLPLTLLNNLQTNLGNTCNPVVLTLPYIDKDITLPCVSALYKQIDGLDVWFQGVGVIAAAVILYKYFIYLYKKVDDTLTLRENTMEGYFDESLWGGM